MGAPGEDLRLSPAAQEKYPYTFESKNTEAINVWAAFAQASAHEAQTGRRPVLVFKRNRSEIMVAMRLDDWLWSIT